MPQHIAVIMDGNRTWAKKNSLSLVDGYKAGIENAFTTVNNCIASNIKYLTLFAFSTENWNRKKSEIDPLMYICSDLFSKKEIKSRIDLKKVRVRFIGDISIFETKNKTLFDRMVDLQEETKNNTSFFLQIAMNYGARMDIVNACKNIMNAEMKANEVTEDIFSKYLYTTGIPDPDFLIRTSGQIRISNFLLWQISYSELYFTDTLWPDFDLSCLKIALDNYQKRIKKHGK